MSIQHRRSTVNDPASGIKPGSSAEAAAILAALDALPPSAPTACTGWNAHHVAAHLAAGSKETADLIEESVPGQPSRPTRGFEERETPFRALSHDKLLLSLGTQVGRKVAALGALALREDSSIDYTGTRVSVDEFTAYARSEAAIHRWDLLGDDDTGTEMLAAPDLTTHAVKMLNRMPILNESARNRATGQPGRCRAGSDRVPQPRPARHRARRLSRRHSIRIRGKNCRRRRDPNDRCGEPTARAVGPKIRQPERRT
jgi:uncharacterized protein (TIGR03083 family)